MSLAETRPAIAASVIAAAALALATCGPESAPQSAVAFTESDSAGIAIVDNVFSAIPGEWTVSTEPTWSLGGLSAPDEQQLSRVNGGRRLPDGRVVIANAGSAEVRVYGPDRSLLASYGRKGDGPGEFQRPGLQAVRNDSVYVFDSQHHRVSIVHLDEGFARSYEVDWTGTGFRVARGLLADGSLAIGGGMSFGSDDGFPTGVIRPESTFGWVAPDGTTETRIGDRPAAEMFAQANDQGFIARMLPFSRVTAAAVADHGLWLGTGDSYELRGYGAGGALERILRINAPTVATTGAMLDAYVEGRVDEGPEGDDQRREIRQQLREMPIADHLPPFRELLVDRLGNLWAADYGPPADDSQMWTVFDIDGRVMGRIRTPDRTGLLDVGEDYVLGLTTDEFDVESLTVWTLARAVAQGDHS